MNLKQIEARIAKLESAHKADPYAGMTYEEIKAKAQQNLERLVGHYGSFAAVVAAMEASGEPALQEGARLMVKRYGEPYGYAASDVGADR